MFINRTNLSSAVNETISAPTSIAEFVRGPNAEPAPEWHIARTTWSWGYQFHWIAFGSLFFLLGIYSVSAFVKALHFEDKISRNLSCAIFSLLIFFGFARAAYFVTSPYDYPSHFGKEVPLLLTRTLFSLGFPCLTAGLAFINVVFVEAASGEKVAHSKLRSVKFLIAVIIVHFTLVLVVDTITFLLMNTEGLFILCIVYFMIIALVSAGRVAYSGCKLIRQNEKIRAEIRGLQNRYSPKDSEIATINTQPEPKGIQKVRIIVFLTIATCLSICVLQSYSIHVIGKVTLGFPVNPKPWPFYAYQTLFRLTELAMACTILYAVTPRSRDNTQHCNNCWKR